LTLCDIRGDFPSLTNCTHLNSAGISPMPRCVTAELFRLHQYVSEYGPAGLLHTDESLVRTEASHRTLAAFLGVDVDEVAFTTQFSTGASLIVEGLAWQQDDEIVITDQEHPALLVPVLNIARRRKLEVRRFPVSTNAEEVLSSLEDALSSHTRLVAVSHVTTEDGTILPVAEITRLAHQKGALVLLDGAQSVGQFPVTLPEINCDFYAFPGYKWLLGPFTSAALFIKREVLDQVEVTWTGSRATKTAGIDMTELEFLPNARRFEFGGRPWAEESALAAGVEYISSLDLKTIEQHARSLALYLHQALRRLPGLRIHSPLDPDKMTGIVTFSVDGFSGTRISASLWERFRILTRPALNGTSVRASIAAFTNESDLDALVHSVGKIVADG
jgi:selenocysteine lyase/cysteine desulfurase